jgi:hypothetical protein
MVKAAFGQEFYGKRRRLVNLLGGILAGYQQRGPPGYEQEDSYQQVWFIHRGFLILGRSALIYTTTGECIADFLKSESIVGKLYFRAQMPWP